jgi:uncharacterized membrane protein YbhN (UPF0104 family)
VIARLTRSLAVRLALTLAVTAVLVARIDLRAAAAALLRLDPWAALAVLALLALDRATMVWRWIVLLVSTGAAVSRKSAAYIYLVSSFVGGFLPAGVGADAARAYSLSRRTAQSGEAVASVAVDRLLGFLSIVVMGMVGVTIAGRTSLGDPRASLSALAVLVVAGGAAMLWADLWVRSVLPRGWHERRLGRLVLRVADALAVYRGHRAALAQVAALSVFVQLLRILQAYVLGRGIGIDVPFSYYLLFMPVGLVALMLPISVAGFGVPQSIIVWLLQPRGVPAPDSFALSTLIVLTGIAGNLPGAWLYLRARRAGH